MEPQNWIAFGGFLLALVTTVGGATAYLHHTIHAVVDKAVGVARQEANSNTEQLRAEVKELRDETRANHLHLTHRIDGLYSQLPRTAQEA
ncbi:MAG: hypothetical protein QM621_07280 [Aeromicrobium sp.]|uniref:hypothetical protein n=1 Tax=Aeromicrobium sp. TaxID=1871063 RepID=UPI0039E4DFF9